QERRLSGEEAQFAEKLRLPVAHDLVAARVEDRHLTLEYRDERITLVADTKQGLAHVRRELLAELAQRLQLRVGERRARGQRCERISPRHAHERSDLVFLDRDAFTFISRVQATTGAASG